VSKATFSDAAAIGRAIPRIPAEVVSERTPDGLIRLQGPVRRRAWLLRIFHLPIRAHVELDDIGTFAVERFGRASVSEIAADLAAHLHLQRREAEVALGDFLRLLLRRGLVELEPTR
jgi:hypothetical protein